MEARDKKRLIYLGIIIVIAIFTFSNRYVINFMAQKSGFENYNDWHDEQVIKTQMQNYKNIKIYSDETIPNDSSLLNALSQSGYTFNIENAQYNSFVNSFSDAVSKKSLLILNSGLVYDYLACLEDDEYDKIYDESLETVIFGLQKLPVIVIIGPKYTFNLEEIGLDQTSSKRKYDDTVKELRQLCDKYNITYIDLYTKTENKPIKFDNESLPQYDDKTCAYLAGQILPILDEYVQNYQDTLREQ